ncbi:MAG: YdbH domain-containing protein [Pseudomonadota bacterium]
MLFGALLYFLMSFLIVRIANPYLLPMGVELRSLKGLQLGSDTLNVANITFAFIGSDTVKASDKESTLTNLQVSYIPSQLLKGQLRKIEIENLTLNLPSEAQAVTSTEDSSTAINIAQWLSTLQTLPLETLSIESLAIGAMQNVRVGVSRNAREFVTQISRDDMRLDLALNWHDEQFVSSYFIPDEQLPGHPFPPQTMTGNLHIASGGESVFEGELTLHENQGQLQADSSGSLQLAAGEQLLRRLDLLPETLGTLAGTVYFSASAQGRTQPPDDQAFNMTLSLLAGSHVRGTVPIPTDSETTITWQATEPLAISGTYTTQNIGMAFTTAGQSVQATLHTGTATQVATLAITQATGDCALPMRCSLQLSSLLNLPAVTYENITIENLDAVGSLALEFDGSIATAILAQGSRIGATSINGPDFTLGEVNLLLQEAMTIHTDAAGDILIDSNGVELFLPMLRFGTNSGHASIKASALMARWPALPDSFPQLSMQLDARTIGSDQLPFKARKPEVSAQLQLSNNILHANSRFRLADREILTAESNIDLNNGTAQIHAEIPQLQFGPDQQGLAYWFQDLPFEADIIAGSVAASADLQLRMDDVAGILVSGPIQLSADKLSGFYTNTAIVDFTTTLSGELIESRDFISRQTQQIRIGSVNPGVPVENIAFNYGVDTRNQTLDLQDLQATLFNGRLLSEGLAYDWGAAENNFILTLERIDLSTLLDMGAYEGIQASGIISGNVPVRIADNAVSVAGGTLHVEAPGGSIRYLSGGTGSSGNAALDLVNQALSNYQYDLLEADVNYQPSGELNLAVRLQGANPDMNQGQRINLNLNISDNIPSLLQSLQSSRSITDALERALQSR